MESGVDGELRVVVESGAEQPSAASVPALEVGDAALPGHAAESRSDPPPAPPPLRRALPWAFAAAVIVALGAAAVWIAGKGALGDDDLRNQIERRGRLVVIGSDDLRELAGSGAEGVAEDEVSGLGEVLDGVDGAALAGALAAADLDGLVIEDCFRDWPALPTTEAEPRSLRQILCRYGSVPSLSASYLAAAAAIYVPSWSDELGASDRLALAHVGRSLLAGARPPRLASFPEPLRRMRSVEVMVMLRERGQRRLWRSARGSSIARALITAAVVARQRWTERERALGGPIDDVLPRLDLEIMLLEEDGTLGDRGEGFVSRVFGPEHGVAFERKGTWRYLRPEATAERGQGSALVAYAGLFEDHGLDPDSLSRSDLRLYRLATKLLARSSAPSPVGSPDPLTGPAGPADGLPEVTGGGPDAP